MHSCISKPSSSSTILIKIAFTIRVFNPFVLFLYFLSYSPSISFFFRISIQRNMRYTFHSFSSLDSSFDPFFRSNSSISFQIAQVSYKIYWIRSLSLYDIILGIYCIVLANSRNSNQHPAVLSWKIFINSSGDIHPFEINSVAEFWRTYTRFQHKSSTVDKGLQRDAGTRRKVEESVMYVCIYTYTHIYYMYVRVQSSDICMRARVPSIVYNTPYPCAALSPLAILHLAHPSPLSHPPIFSPGAPRCIPATLPGVT